MIGFCKQAQGSKQIAGRLSTNVRLAMIVLGRQGNRVHGLHFSDEQLSLLATISRVTLDASTSALTLQRLRRLTAPLGIGDGGPSVPEPDCPVAWNPQKGRKETFVAVGVRNCVPRPVCAGAFSLDYHFFFKSTSVPSGCKKLHAMRTETALTPNCIDGCSP